MIAKALNVYLVVLSIALCSTSPASAAKTGNELLHECEGGETTRAEFYELICMGYVSGVADTLILERNVCPPDNYTNGQTLSVVMKFLKTNPEITHHAAPTLILQALSGAWPCHPEGSR